MWSKSHNVITTKCFDNHKNGNNPDNYIMVFFLNIGDTFKPMTAVAGTGSFCVITKSIFFFISL